MIVLTQAYLEWEQQTEQQGEQRGEQRSRLEEAQAIILRQLTRRIDEVAPEVRSQVQALSLAQLESLGKALLDFTEAGDLERWLEGQSG